MAAKKNPRKRSNNGPRNDHRHKKIRYKMAKFKKFQDIQYPVGITVEQSSNEGDSRAVPTGKGPMIYGERKEHVFVVQGARSADKVFEKANYEEIKKSA